LVRRLLVRRSPSHQGTRTTPLIATNDHAHKRRPKATGAGVPNPQAVRAVRESADGPRHFSHLVRVFRPLAVVGSFVMPQPPSTASGANRRALAANHIVDAVLRRVLKESRSCLTTPSFGPEGACDQDPRTVRRARPATGGPVRTGAVQRLQGVPAPARRTTRERPGPSPHTRGNPGRQSHSQSRGHRAAFASEGIIAGPAEPSDQKAKTKRRGAKGRPTAAFPAKRSRTATSSSAA
jgi:hypothetical protein